MSPRRTNGALKKGRSRERRRERRRGAEGDGEGREAPGPERGVEERGPAAARRRLRARRPVLGAVEAGGVDGGVRVRREARDGRGEEHGGAERGRGFPAPPAGGRAPRAEGAERGRRGERGGRGPAPEAVGVVDELAALVEARVVGGLAAGRGAGRAERGREREGVRGEEGGRREREGRARGEREARREARRGRPRAGPGVPVWKSTTEF